MAPEYAVQMLDKMVNMKYTIPENADTSPEGRDLLQRMLLPDPHQRIQLEQVTGSRGWCMPGQAHLGTLLD
jgi:hypothetical protein